MPTISQRIALEGAEEIRRQLQAMGKAGTASFEQIEAAGIAAAQGLDRVTRAVANVEERFAALGAAASRFGQSFSGVASGLTAVEGAATRTVRQITVMAAAVTGAATAFGLLVKSSADAADKIEESAQALGISTTAFQAFEVGAKQAGVSGEQFSKALGRLSKDVEKEADAQRKSVLELAQELLKPLPAPTIPLQNIGKLREALSGIAQELQSELGKVGANRSIGQLTQQLVQLVAGSEKARETLKGLGINIPVDKLGLLDDSIKKLEPTLASLGIAVRNSNGSTRDLEGVLGDLAEKFKELGPGTEATALAIAKFGRSGQQLIPFLLKGRQGVKDLVAEFEKLQIGFTDEQIKSGGKLSDSFVTLGAVLTGLKNQFGAQFFGLFQEGVDALTDSLVGAAGKVKELGREFALLAAGPIKSLLGLFTGQFEDESQLEVADKMAAGFEKFKTQATAAIKLVIDAFGALARAVEVVAAPIQKVFGSELSGGAILAAAAVLRFLGVFALVGAALTLVTRSIGLVVSGFVLLGRAIQALGASAAALRFLPLIFAGFAAALGPVIVAVGLVALAFKDSRDKIIEIWTGLREQIVSITANLIETILRSLGAQQGDTAFSWLKRGWDAAWDSIKAAAPQNARQVVQLLFSFSPLGLFDWLKKSWDGTWGELFTDVFRKLEDLYKFMRQFTPLGVFDALIEAWNEAWKKITGTTKEKAAEATKALKAVEPSTEELQTGLKDAGIEAERMADKIVRGSQDSAQALDEAAKSAKALGEANAAVKPPAAAPAGGGGGGGGRLPDVAGGGGAAVGGGGGPFETVSTSAEAATQSVKALEDQIADLANEARELKRQRLGLMDEKDFLAAGRRIKQIGGQLGGLQDKLTKAIRTRQLALEQEAAAERARIGFHTREEGEAFEAARRAPGPAPTPKIIQAPGATIEGSTVAPIEVKAPPGGKIIAAPAPPVARPVSPFDEAGFAPPKSAFDEAGFAELGQAASEAASGLDELTQDEAQRNSVLSQSAEGAGEALKSIDERAESAAQSFGDLGPETSAALKQASDDLAKELSQAGQPVREFTQGLESADPGGALQDVTQAVSPLDGALNDLATSAGNAARELESIKGGELSEFASGGMVSGPGTATSDSILARLSRGEFIVRAAAVQHFGPRFFAALNALRMPKLSAGGFIDGLSSSLSSLAPPRFADGGLAVSASAGSRTPITLVLPDGRKIGGLFGTDGAVNQLKREVVSQQVISAGRKPNWVR